MSSNFSATLQGEGSGQLVFTAFLLPILYVTIAFLTVTGEAIAKRFCARVKPRVAVRRKFQSRVYSVEKTKDEVLQEALKRSVEREVHCRRHWYWHWPCR